jgi:hypothetical protein
MAGFSEHEKCASGRRDGLNLLDPEKLPYDQEGGNFPYYFVAGEVFPLKSYFMRPYPKRRLNNRKRGYCMYVYMDKYVILVK